MMLMYAIRQIYQVSILVLMDVGLRYLIQILACQHFQGFNPCFNGCRSAIIRATFDDGSVVWFQSLF